MSTDFTTTTDFSAPTPPPPVVYAGFWIRFVAIFIDGLIISIPSLIIGYMVPVVGSILVSLLYKPFFESSRLQATPGKALMGLCVTTLTGERLTLKKAFIRYLSSLLSSLTMAIGYLMAAFTQRHQALHDFIADTVVIYRSPAPGINYLDAWINEIQVGFGFLSESTKDTSVTQKLEELHALFNKGLITEAEFAQKKQDLLNRM